MTGLTPKQHELMLYLQRYVRANGVCPTFDEMTATLGGTSKSNAHRLFAQLIERGYVQRLAHRARAVEIVREIPDPDPPGYSAVLDFLASEKAVAVLRKHLFGGKADVVLRDLAMAAREAGQ